MCDFIDRLIDYLKPIIVDIDVKRNELDNQKETIKAVKNFLSFVNNDINNIKDFNNQELIFSHLERCNSNKQEYEAMIYLMNAQSESVRSLPQFDIAKEYMKKILEYFKVLNDVLNFRIYELENIYHTKYIANKYYKIFSGKEPFVDDTDEFSKFIDEITLNNQDKISILQYAIQKNVEYYENESNDELPKLEVDRKQDLMKIHEIIHENKNILTDKYIQLYDEVKKYINLNDDILNIVNNDIINIIDINNVILAKKIWLMKKITSNYKACQFARLSKYVNEYDKLINIEEKSLNKSTNEILRIIRGE